MMKNMRLLLRDRLSAGAIAGMIAFMLLFQALLSGAASAADPLGVICTMEGMGPAGGDKQPARSLAESPCGTLCQRAVATTPGLPGGSLPSSSSGPRRMAQSLPNKGSLPPKANAA